jgi:serine protease Do
MSADGYIITNAHVINYSKDYQIKVVLYDKKEYKGSVVGFDKTTDLAVIKINAAGLTAAEFGYAEDLSVGDSVLAIGNPGGIEFSSSLTGGLVSALNRSVGSSSSNGMTYIQTDAAINPGNSGGALVNMYGQVVGINSSKIVATGYEGLGFSIPVAIAQPIISDLKQYGYVKDRAVLGVSGQYIDTVTSRFYNLPTGMYVSSVSSAEVTKAGIKKGDVITKIDGKSITSQNVITTIVTSKKPGDTVSLSVTSSLTGETFTATVKLSQSTGK